MSAARQPRAAEPTAKPGLKKASPLLPALLFACLASAPLLADLVGLGYYVKLLTQVLMLGLAGMALDFALGLGGMVSLGHAAFIGVGAYTVGILAEQGITSALVRWPLALLLSGLAAAAIGALSVRSRDIYFIMLTLAFAQMLYYAAVSLSRYGGDDGLTVWQTGSFGRLVDLHDRTQFYYLVLAILLAAYLGLRRAAAARFGRALRGIALNERRMAALGFATGRIKLAAFTISGTITGLAGALLAEHTGFVAPAYMTWLRSGELIVVVVLGGMGTLHGAILGALVYRLAEEALAGITTHWPIIMGPVIILVVLVGRGGLPPLVEAGLRHLLGRGRQARPKPASA